MLDSNSQKKLKAKFALLFSKIQHNAAALCYLLCKPKIITLDGIKLHMDRKVLSPSLCMEFYFGTYECSERKIIKHTLEADDVLMELGGGVGFMGMLASKYLSNHANIHIFEANPHLIEVMKRNFELNQVQPHVYNCILGNEKGSAPFYISNDFWESSLIPLESYKEKIIVEKESFAEVIQKIKPTFLLIDIEGGEINLFKTITATDIASVKKICIELHPRNTSAADITTLIKRFMDYGFLLDLKHQAGTVFYFVRP